MNALTSLQKLCLVCIVGAVSLDVYMFSASRNDPGLRMAALVATSNLITALIAIPSVLLTGKDLSVRGSHDPADFPAGSEFVAKETVKTPPITTSESTE